MIRLKCKNPDCNHHYTAVLTTVKRKEKKLTVILVCMECASVNALTLPMYEYLEIQEDYNVPQNSLKKELTKVLNKIHNEENVIDITGLLKRKKRYRQNLKF